MPWTRVDDEVSRLIIVQELSASPTTPRKTGNYQLFPRYAHIAVDGEEMLTHCWCFHGNVCLRDGCIYISHYLTENETTFVIESTRGCKGRSLLDINSEGTDHTWKRGQAPTYWPQIWVPRTRKEIPKQKQNSKGVEKQTYKYITPRSNHWCSFSAPQPRQCSAIHDFVYNFLSTTARAMIQNGNNKQQRKLKWYFITKYSPAPS